MRLCISLLLLLGAVAFAEPASPRVVERYRQMLQANPTEGIALDRLWKIAVEDGRTGEWIAEYRKAGTFASEMILGHLLRKAGQAVEAENAYVRASALEPASVLPLLALGRAAGERGEPRQAAVWLEKAVALLAKDDPRVADALMQLGAAWSAGGEPARAVEAWERTIEFAPDDLDLRRRLASACAEGNLPDAAIRHFEFIATRANPGERVQALEQIARLQSAAGRHDDAMVTLERAVGITAPGNWRRAELLGQIIRLAQRRHAEEELERRWLDQAAASPRDLGCCLQLVEFYERTGNLERQREWLEKSLGLSPRNAEYEVRLARLLVQLDQVDDAAAHLDRALALEPRNTDRVFERAALDLRREDGVAARRRILALLAEHKGDDALRERALAFCQEHHLLDLVEEQLRAGAAGGSEEGIFALANFHFTQRRNADARAALQRIADGGGTDAARAARHLRAAQLLKAHGELSAAIGQVESALKLQRDSREGNLLLGEMRAGVLQFHEARIAFEAAYDLSRTDAERIEADGKLFESLRAGASLSQDAKAPGASAAARVEGHIRELMGRAGEETTAAAWLRVARWKAWNGDKASAVTFATKAADLEPKNPAPREFLARHAQANGESAYAVAYLREAMELNPAGRDGYLREIAQIELQIGNSAEALSILEQLARANPGHMDALSDLASAQERAGRLQEAATTLRRMLSIAPAPRKRETGALLLRVLEKLGLPDEGADLLLRSMDGAQDERERFNRFDELLLYCQRQERLPWLRSLLESRRKGRADDYFSTVALGRVLKLLGEKGAAFDLFADAVYSTPDQRLALPDLVREAEELGRLDAAVRLQEQFTRIAPQERPDGFLKLAALQLKTGDLEGTERTWERAVAKFPRDAEVLRQGADFH
ncbi:MAG: tetratricopeptide repeat protein, partial [Chthoniobacteraceae bacterium]